MVVKTSKLGPGSLTIGVPASAREWGGQLTKCALNPSTEFEDNVPVLSGEEVAGDATTTWNLSGTIFQSYDLDSLEDFAFVNRLKDLPFVFTPSKAGKREYSGTVTIVPLTVGGDVKVRNTSDFEFRVVGEPTPGART
jgi:hypothetical protein